MNFKTGKSSIISAFIRLTKLPTLVLVNKVTLGNQIREGLMADGIDCGICSGSGVRKGLNMISTIQSVKKDKNRVGKAYRIQKRNAEAHSFKS